MEQDYIFITLEGIDGSGKSSQIQLIKDILKKQGIECILNKEPGGTEIGSKIREVFLYSKGLNEKLTEDANMMLVVSAMNQSLNYKIKPALDEGKAVISDRFIDSTIAYQGSSSPENEKKALMLKDTFLKVEPSLTLLFDLPAELANERIRQRDIMTGNKIKDNLESKGIKYFNKVREKYLQMSKNNPRFKIIDASKSVADVSYQVESIVKKYLNELKINKNKRLTEKTNVKYAP